MLAKVILNPYAGRWLALERREEVEESLRSSGVKYEMVMTEYPEHGTSLAAQAVRNGFDPIISVGGDGSISEVVNGMMSVAEGNRDKSVSLGVIPLGSANDFADNMGLPRDMKAAAEVISTGKSRIIDLGVVQVGREGKKRYFDNNAAIGLEPYVTVIQKGINRMRGTLRYLVATILAVRDNPQWSMRLEWESGSYQGPITLVTVGNLPRTGGVFFMTPNASATDGLLTFVYGFMPTRRQILRLLPRTMKPGEGSYIEHPSVHQLHTSWIKVFSEQPTPAHADGVVLSTAVQHLEYRVLPESLSVLTP